MIYLDNGATSFPKPPEVYRAVCRAMQTCTSPGRGGYPMAMEADRVVFRGRELAAELFDCEAEQVVFTASCTHGLNIAIRSLVKRGTRVVISGFEHNAVTRPLRLLGAEVRIAGRKLFDWEDTVREFEKALCEGAQVAVFTQTSNVFGYILPVEQLADLCKKYKVPFILDAAQGAGMLPISLRELGADFIAMPGHKGLLGPQGTGILLCRRLPEVLLAGGTGSESKMQEMPGYLPDRAEPGTLNVPGIAGLAAGMSVVKRLGQKNILEREQEMARRCIPLLESSGYRVFSGEHQTGTVSFVPETDREEMAEKMSQRGIAVRSGLHCAPLAHESAGTLHTGTVRISFGHDASQRQYMAFVREFGRI